MLSVVETEKVWRPFAKDLVVPHDEAGYEQLVQRLDDLIDEGRQGRLLRNGENKQHPLASLMEVISVLIERYESENVPEL